MNRCLPLVAILCTLGISATVAHAQTNTGSQNLIASDGTVVAVRNFPANALRGTLLVQAAPEVLLDGITDRLSPGVRIRGTNGMLTLSATLTGLALPVMYTREPSGMLHEVWIMTELEAQLIPSKPSYSK